MDDSKMEDSPRHKNAEKLFPRYKLGKSVGIGTHSKVKVADHVLTGHKVAIKILSQRKMDKAMREIKILRLLMHPHVIRYYETVETTNDIFIITEYVDSGELFDHIVRKGRLPEDEARKYFQQIIAGVEYCHRNMVVHRDLKPDNLLLDSKGNIKIADFGLSNIMRDGHFLKTSCGSPNYAAPEILSGKLYAGPEVDVWSCGVILYVLLCGTLPFDDENIPNLFKKIKTGTYKLPSHLSAATRDLISRLLVVDPIKRMTIAQIRLHPWFQTGLPSYLAVLHSETAQHAKILQEVVTMGFDRKQLVESLKNRTQNDGTVAYYLVLDNRFKPSSGYSGATINDSKSWIADQKPPSEVSSPTMAHHHHRLTAVVDCHDKSSNSNPSFPTGKWALWIIESGAHPREIMTLVLKALQELNVCWKKIGHYNIKCRWGYHNVCHQNNAMNVHSNSYFLNGSISNEIVGAVIRAPIIVVKFEIQLFGSDEGKYVLDLQNLQGPQFLFMELCFALFAQLRVV